MADFSQITEEGKITFVPDSERAKEWMLENLGVAVLNYTLPEEAANAAEFQSEVQDEGFTLDRM